MAVWHYKCSLVPYSTEEPLNKVLDKDGFIPSIKEDWEVMDTGKRLLKHIDKSLKSTKSWSEDILMFGSKDNRLEIALFENSNNVEYVSVRMDLRTNDWQSFLLRLIPLCEKLRLKVYDCYSFYIFEANAGTFKNSITSSNAAKFVTNPEKFLTSINRADDA